LFDPLPEHLATPPGLRPAAVLVPVFGPGPLGQGALLFTVRAPHLAHHRGQISFPGGRLEPGESPAEGALREAYEEVRLPPERVRLLGALRPVLSPAGFWVLPVVGRVEGSVEPVPNPEEVAEVFLAPISELQAARAWPEWRRGRYVWHYPWRGRDIWGVTGNILHDFLARLEGKEAE